MRRARLGSAALTRNSLRGKPKFARDLQTGGFGAVREYNRYLSL
jgi:hypothetical protein